MTNYNNIPALRFKEFEGEWEVKKLGECSIKVGSGKTPKGGEQVYTKSGIYFIRSQNVFGDKLHLENVSFIPKEINDKMKGSIVKPNDILLNITGASIGRSCVVPNDFTTGNVNQHVSIIRLKDAYSPEFVQSYLSSFDGQKAIFRSQVGSGREGLNFKSIRLLKLYLPTKPEQQKIANFLTTIDTKIQQLRQKEQLLDKYKKGVMQQIFKQEIRFKKDDGGDFEDWEIVKLKDVLSERKTRNKDNKYNEVFSVAKSKGVINQIEHLGRSYASSDISNYKVVFPNDIVYTKSPTSNFPYGIIKQNQLDRIGVVSVLYAVLKPKNKYLGFLLHNYFLSWQNTYNYLHPLVHKGAKNTMNINNSIFLNGRKIKLPVNIQEQQKIANFLSSIDKRIASVQAEIVAMEEYKQGLLQVMFV